MIPKFPVIPNSKTWLFNVHTDSEWLTVIGPCPAFFSILAEKESQYLFAFHLEKSKYTWTIMPQRFPEAPYFSQALHQDWITLQFPWNSPLIRHVDYLLLCSLSKVWSEMDSLYLLQQLAHKGHKVLMESLQFSRGKFHFLRHDLTVERVSKRIKTTQGFPWPTAKR